MFEIARDPNSPVWVAFIIGDVAERLVALSEELPSWSPDIWHNELTERFTRFVTGPNNAQVVKAFGRSNSHTTLAHCDEVCDPLIVITASKDPTVTYNLPPLYDPDLGIVLPHPSGRGITTRFDPDILSPHQIQPPKCPVITCLITRHIGETRRREAYYATLPHHAPAEGPKARKVIIGIMKP